MPHDRAERARDARLRRLAQRQGLAVEKSRRRLTFPFNVDDYGGYRIIDPFTNWLVCGEKFDLSLDEVEAALREG